MNTDVRNFLVDIAENELFTGKEYKLRIEIDDGGMNSYIGFNVDLDDWKANGKIQSLRIYRHTNTPKKLVETWDISLGNICNEYHCYPDIPIRFSSYGKTPEEAAEARGYFKRLRRLIQKCTAEYKAAAAESAQDEKAALLARLAELENVGGTQ